MQAFSCTVLRMHLFTVIFYPGQYFVVPSLLACAECIKTELVDKTDYATQLSKSLGRLSAKENYKVLCNSPYSL